MNLVQVSDRVLPHGITLRCRSTAPAGARPQALLLHGFPEAAFVWDEVMGLLAPEHPTLAPNLRGYVGSSAPAAVEAYRARHLVQDLAALIESTGASAASPLPLLVAHDWGGAVGWGLAAARPELIQRLLIINSPHPGTFLRELRESPEQIAASAYMNFLVRPDAAALLAESDFARLFNFLRADSWLDEATREHYRQAWHNEGRGLDPMLNWYRASPLRPATDADSTLHSLQLPDAMLRVTVPTTVLWGEADIALRPGLLDGLGHWVPELDVKRVPEATHWLVHERPSLVAETIRGLLRQGQRAS
jgi:epoxide hydrolase 4